MPNLPLPALCYLSVSLAVSSVSPSVEAKPEILEFEGEAYRLGDEPGGNRSSLLYTEQHRQTGNCLDGYWRPLQDSVTYRDAEGKPRGSKSVDSRISHQRPSFILVDEAFNERIEVRNEEDRQAQIVYDEYQEPDRQTFEVPLTGDGVIDAGFDQWVVERWEELAAGDTLSFEFLAAPRGKMFNFEAEKAGASLPTEGDHVIRIRPAGFIANFTVDPIYLAYNDQRLLTDYVGLSNLRRDAKSNFKVHIRYQYPETPNCQ